MPIDSTVRAQAPTAHHLKERGPRDSGVRFVSGAYARIARDTDEDHCTRNLIGSIVILTERRGEGRLRRWLFGGPALACPKCGEVRFAFLEADLGPVA